MRTGKLSPKTQTHTRSCPSYWTQDPSDPSKEVYTLSTLLKALLAAQTVKRTVWLSGVLPKTCNGLCQWSKNRSFSVDDSLTSIRQCRLRASPLMGGVCLRLQILSTACGRNCGEIKSVFGWETCSKALSSSGACGWTGCLRAFKRDLDQSSRCSGFGTAEVQWRRPVLGKCVWPWCSQNRTYFLNHRPPQAKTDLAGCPSHHLETDREKEWLKSKTKRIWLLKYEKQSRKMELIGVWKVLRSLFQIFEGSFLHLDYKHLNLLFFFFSSEVSGITV